MLPAVRDLVKRQGLASVQEVALHLGVPADVARALLHKWVDKGRIAPVRTPPSCSGCTLCDSTPRELYRWCDSGADIKRSDAQSGTDCKIRVPSKAESEPFQGQTCDRPESQSSS